MWATDPGIPEKPLDLGALDDRACPTGTLLVIDTGPLDGELRGEANVAPSF